MLDINPDFEKQPKKPELKPMISKIDGSDDDLTTLDQIENILDLDEALYPRFTLAKKQGPFLENAQLVQVERRVAGRGSVERRQQTF